MRLDHLDDLVRRGAPGRVVGVTREPLFRTGSHVVQIMLVAGLVAFLLCLFVTGCTSDLCGHVIPCSSACPCR